MTTLLDSQNSRQMILTYSTCVTLIVAKLLHEYMHDNTGA